MLLNSQDVPTSWAGGGGGSTGSPGGSPVGHIRGSLDGGPGEVVEEGLGEAPPAGLDVSANGSLGGGPR